MNPFKYGTIVLGKDFCGRKAEIQQLVEHLEASQNVVIQGKRRIGKSSLIFESIRQYKKRRPLKLDCMEVKSVDMLCKRIIHAILALESRGALFQRLLKNLTHLQPRISADPVTGMPSLSFDSQIKITTESLPQIMALIEKLNKESPIIVVMDEFQDILKTEDPQAAMALLRGEIQHQAGIPYIFSGSSRNQMDHIFTHPDSAFFKSAIPMTVEPLTYRTFGLFLQKRFDKGERSITGSLLTSIFDIADQNTGDIQQFCKNLWTLTSPGTKLTSRHLHRALDQICGEQAKAYASILSTLTAAQLQVLSALAQAGGKNTASAEFVRASGTANASSVRSSLQRMVQLNLLYQENKEYKFFDPFFRVWIQQSKYLDL